MRSLLALVLALIAQPLAAQGYLRAEGTRIVDGAGRPVILRGMGLGGWMLQEGYMLQLGELGRGQQHVIRRQIAALIGEAKTAAFYRAWLDNHTTEADIAQMAAWGFNSVRLPMHHALLIRSDGSWDEEGFARIDRLLEWCARHRIWLILDLHAAPGGQGTDLPIADRDPATPSLWESAENRWRTVALWGKLARRYRDQPWVGAYDIINEPNWDFTGEGDGHGCKEERNAPLRALSVEITRAIRAEDKRHLIVAEGNCWSNNYAGMMPPWDDNLALSFHKYWNRTDRASIAGTLALRDRHRVPVWLGEAGENSNVWFRNTIALVEGEGIGWAFWPWKKIGFNQPLEIAANPGWAKLVAYWTAKGPRPSAAEAERTLMTLATRDIRFENNVRHADVVDAMLRQPHDATVRPFRPHRVGAPIAAVDYDLGPAGAAYADRQDANYHVATGGAPTLWNGGRTYRNDGVDIRRLADGRPVVAGFETGEWMRYTVTAPRAGRYRVTMWVASRGGGTLRVSGVSVRAPAGGWRTVRSGPVTLAAGTNAVRVEAVTGEMELDRLIMERLR